MERYELPDGWEWVELGELSLFVGSGVTPKGGQKIYKPSGIPFIRSQNVYPDGLRLHDIVYISEQIHNSMARTHVKPRDVLLNITGASIGRSTVVPKVFGQANVNQHVCIIRLVPEVEPQYLSRFLNSPIGQTQIMDSQSGVTRQGLNYSQLRKILIPFAPLDEQQYIVTKIERLFDQSRTARAALRRVTALMSQFRRAVLASAFRGELVESDPNDEPAASLLERVREARIQSGYKKSIEPLDTSDLPELPDGWEWAKVEQIAEVRLGRQRSPARATGPNMRPYLRAANVTWNGLDLSDVKEMDFTPAEQKAYRLRVGDLILSEASGSISEVGKPAIWNDEIENCCIQNTLIRVRTEGPLPKYLYYHFLFDALTARFRDVAQGISINHLGANGLSNWVISVPPLKAQQRIVDKIEAMFAQADIIEQAASVSLRRAEQVDQSILARAFRGELG